LEENRRKIKSKRKLTLIYDSTGLSHRIGGYYRISKYGIRIRRWFKLHVLIDIIQLLQMMFQTSECWSRC